jgi:hypothetical protein
MFYNIKKISKSIRRVNEIDKIIIKLAKIVQQKKGEIHRIHEKQRERVSERKREIDGWTNRQFY